MNDGITTAVGEEFLQPPLDRVRIQRLLVGLVRSSRKEQPPKAVAIVSRDLEQRAPFVGVGKVIAGAVRMFGVEGEGCGQHQKTLRMRISLESRAERLAYRGATAVRADQVRSIELVRASRVLDQHLDPVIELPQRRDPRGKIHSGLGKAP